MPLSSITARRTAPLIGPLSKYSCGSEMQAVLTPASAAWPTANLAYLIPLYLPRADMLYKFWVWNGATASSNIDIGLYRASDLSKVVSSGSVAQAGTNVIQSDGGFDVADTIVPAGSYYMACAFSSTAGTVFRVQNGNGSVVAAMGVASWATGGLPMGATATLSTVAALGSFVPLFGVAFRSVT